MYSRSRSFLAHLPTCPPLLLLERATWCQVRARVRSGILVHQMSFLPFTGLSSRCVPRLTRARPAVAAPWFPTSHPSAPAMPRECLNCRHLTVNTAALQPGFAADVKLGGSVESNPI
ncbi:hypothetical protein EON67_02740, partial [archaeon]